MPNAALSVIVVDDQAPFRLAARAVLRRTDGFELVGEAGNGLEAITLAEDVHPDLVLMDINMPEMGGIEATRKIMAELPDTVVILCSTYGVADLPPEAKTVGPAPTYTKSSSTQRPFNACGTSATKTALRADQPSGTEPRMVVPSPNCDSQRTAPPMAPSRSIMLT